MSDIMKGFKKVGSTDTHTTFQHPDGHILHVSNKKLDKSKKSEMKAIPEKKMYQGGKAEKDSQLDFSDDEGSEVSPDSVYQDEMEPHGYADGTPDQPVQPDEASGFDAVSGQPIPNEPMAQSAIPQVQPQQGIMPDIMQGLQDTSNAERQYGQTAAEIGQAALGEQTNAADQMQRRTMAAVQDAQKSLKMSDQIAAHLNNDQDPDNHINPNRYRENQSVGSKIATAIGLALGGFGQSVSGSNPAMDFLNKQIDRDVASQQANINNKVTLMGELQKQFGNKMQAADMTRLALMNSNAMKMSALASQQGGQQAKLNAAHNIYQMQQQAMPYALRIGYMEQLKKDQQSGAIDPSNPVQSHAALPYLEPDPKAQEAMEKEYGTAQAAVAAHKSIDGIMNQVVGQQNMNRVVSPVQSKQVIDAARAQLIPLVTKFSPSKRLTDTIVDEQINKLMPQLLSSKATAATMAQNLHNIVNMGTDPTPQLEGLETRTGIPMVPRYSPRQAAPQQRNAGPAKAQQVPKGWELNPSTGKYRRK